MLRKDDPIYYKEKINDLMKQALDESLKVEVQVLEDGVKVYFEASNGDVAGVILTETNFNCRCNEKYCVYNDGFQKCHYEGNLIKNNGDCSNKKLL